MSTAPVNRCNATKSSDNVLIKHLDGIEPKALVGKYKATTLWNNIVRQFRDEMPLKRHRRQLTYFDDSFTGKEAVDFLMVLLPRLVFEGRQVDRFNCITLLQKFVDQGFIKRARPNPNEKEIFRDNTSLYIFVDDCTPCGMVRTPRLVRTSSYHEELQCRSCSPTKAYQSPETDYSTSTYRTISSPTTSHGFNGRLSTSYGNLLSLSHSSKVLNSANSTTETVDSRRVEVNFQLRPSPTRCDTLQANNTSEVKDAKMKLSQTEKKKTSDEELANRKKHAKVVSQVTNGECEKAYEWLSFMRGKKTIQCVIMKKQTEKETTSLLSVKSEKEKQSSSQVMDNHNDNDAQFDQQMKTICAPLQVTDHYVTEVDMWRIWKECLLSRLHRILCVENFSVVDWNVNGQDVKWNCQRVGSSGIVKQRNDREVFSGYIMRLMRYLEQFPFPSGSSNVIIYKDNQEVNIFKTVCSRLSRESALLTKAEVSAMTKVISLCRANRMTDNTLLEKTNSDILQSSLRIETEFGESAPHSRFVPRPSNTFLYRNLKTNALCCSSHAEHQSFSAANKSILMQNRKVLSVLQEDHVYDFSSKADEAKNFSRDQSQAKYYLEGLPKNMDVFQLPGLRKSPELVQRLDEMCSTFCDKTAVMLEALSLILLTLPPQRRRRLHHLVRFMNKIAANHCLQLDYQHNNRYMVLKELSGCIVSMGPEPSPVSPSQSIHLVAVLLDYEHEIFTMPASLGFEVDTLLREQQVEKLIGNEGRSEKPPARFEKRSQCCILKQEHDYDEQKRDLNKSLLELLDEICKGEDMSVIEKRKRLKKFKKTYPSVYAQKFPFPDPKKHGRKEDKRKFLAKLF